MSMLQHSMYMEQGLVMMGRELVSFQKQRPSHQISCVRRSAESDLVRYTQNKQQKIKINRNNFDPFLNMK